MFYKIDPLKNFPKFTGKTCAGVSGVSYSKEALTQVFYCGFYEIFKNTSFTENLRTTTILLIFDCNGLIQKIFQMSRP